MSTAEERSRNVVEEREGTCVQCKQTCTIFSKFVLGRSIGLGLYLLDILTDVNVALDDYKTGDKAFAFVTVGLIFAPGTLFALYMFFEYLFLYIGEMACMKAPLWVLTSPLLPVWVILRNLVQILEGIVATLFPSKREKLVKRLTRPSRAYLVKFLEAFTESAPQLLVRLCKVALRSRKQFSDFRTSEVVQITVSLVTLSLQIVSTHQKNISTQQVIEGHAELDSKESLPWYLKIVALIWWFCFLISRFEALALFSASYEYWVLLVIGIHVLLVFLFQTVGGHKETLKKIFIYLFGAFVFIFSYVQFNLRTRIHVAAWFPYTLFAIIMFVENAIMMTFWFFDQRSFLDTLPTSPSNVSERLGNITAPPSGHGVGTLYLTTIYTPEELENHWRLLIYFHFGVFGVGLVFMILLFLVSSLCIKEQNYDLKSHERGDVQELQTMVQNYNV